MTMKTFLAGAAFAASLAAAAAASATVIDFEGGTPGTAIGSDYSGLGATFTDAFYQQCGGGCPDPATGIFASSVDETGPFTVTFAQLQSSVSFINVSFSSVTANAYDSGGNLVATVTDSQGFPISGTVDMVNGVGIKYVTFTNAGGGYGIDDLGFGGGVPEPATWALMLMGIAGMGAAIRGRRKALAVTA